MATILDTGFESGNANDIAALGSGSTVQTATVIRGAYSLKQTNNASTLKTGLSVTQSICRAYVIPVAYPGTTQDILVERLGAGTNRLHCELLSTGTLRLREGPGTTLGFVQVTSTKPIVLGTVYCLEMAVDLSAGGIVRLWIDGNLAIDATHPTDATASPTTSWIAGGLASPNQMIFDDIRLDTGTVAQIGMIPVAASSPASQGGSVGGRRRERLARSPVPPSETRAPRRDIAPERRAEVAVPRSGERTLPARRVREERGGLPEAQQPRPFNPDPLIAAADALIAERLAEQDRLAQAMADAQAEQDAADAAEAEALAMILIAANS